MKRSVLTPSIFLVAMLILPPRAVSAQSGTGPVIGRVEWVCDSVTELQGIASLRGVRAGLSFPDEAELELWVLSLNDALDADPAAGPEASALLEEIPGRAGSFLLSVRLPGRSGALDLVPLPDERLASGARPVVARPLSGASFAHGSPAFALPALVDGRGGRESRVGLEAGLSDGMIYGLPSFAWGRVFAESGDDITAYLAFQAAIGYERARNGMSDKNILVDLAFGFAGRFPFPWMAGATSITSLDVADRASAEFRIAAEPLDFGELPLHLYAGMAAFYSSATTRSSLEGSLLFTAGELSWIEGQAQGLFASADLVGTVDLNLPDVFASAGADMRWACRLGETLGFDATAALDWLSAEDAGWAGRLRGVSDSLRPVSGFAGLSWRMDLPVTLARGILFRNDGLPIHLTLAALSDGAVILSSGRAFGDPGTLLVTAGGEILMTLDTRRTDFLRISAGWDLSNLLNGTASAMVEADLELVAALGLFF